MGFKLTQSLETIDQLYREAADKPKQIEIIADMNETESAYIALLLQRMGHDVDHRKMPRPPRTEGGVDKKLEFEESPYSKAADAFREAHFRTVGRVVANTVRVAEAASPVEIIKPANMPDENKAEPVEKYDLHEEKQEHTKEQKCDESESQIQRIEDTLQAYGAKERLAFLMWGMFLEEKYGKVPFNADDLEVLGQLRGVAERVK